MSGRLFTTVRGSFGVDFEAFTSGVHYLAAFEAFLLQFSTALTLSERLFTISEDIPRAHFEALTLGVHYLVVFVDSSSAVS